MYVGQWKKVQDLIVEYTICLSLFTWIYVCVCVCVCFFLQLYCFRFVSGALLKRRFMSGLMEYSLCCFSVGLQSLAQTKILLCLPC